MPEVSIRGHFLWHELITSDPQGATAFYGKIIGWRKEKWEQDTSYTVLGYKGSPMAGVMKGSGQPRWMTYIGTPDVEVTAWEAQRLGGKLLEAPTTTPNVGKWAILQAPQGAVFAAYTPERTPKVGHDAGVGDFSWHELATADHAAAFEFYRELFGWKQTGSFDMGPQGTYLMFGIGKQTLGGIYSMTGEQSKGPASWLSYIRVPDVRKTTRVIQNARAQVLSGPMEVPGGDWITQGQDPQGAVFAIHAKPARRAVKKKAAPRKAKKAASARKAGSKKVRAVKSGSRKKKR